MVKPKDLELAESINEVKYRIYMNSDADEPNEISYEEYFGDGDKAAMIRKAQELAKDGKNQYGDPIKIAVTAEDDISDVAWTNESVNEGRASKELINMVKNLDDFFAGISRDRQVSLSVEGDWTDETDPYFQTGDYDDLTDDEAKNIIKFASDLAKRNDIKLPSELVNEGHMEAPYEYDNISEPYSIKVGDMVKNTNPSCKHFGSQGMVKQVIGMPDDIGQLIRYVVMNQGNTYKPGSILTKTPDQLEIMQ